MSLTIAAPCSSPKYAVRLFTQPGHAHLVGIGGAGMRSLAAVLAGSGWTVSGSDTEADSFLDANSTAARPLRGHAAENIPAGTTLVVYSAAVPTDNSECLAATSRGLPLLSYAEALGGLMQHRVGVAIAGTHGKSTVTAMAATILAQAGLEPSIICGAQPMSGTAPSGYGGGQHLLVEACEYRGSFLQLSPRHAAILNLEADHFDCYATSEQLVAAFRQFAERVPAEGTLLVPYDASWAHWVTSGAAASVETFGTDRRADWSAQGLYQERGLFGFRLFHDSTAIAHVQLAVPGEHNALNALAAAAISSRCGASAEAIAAGLAAFAGLRRRMELVGTFSGVHLLDDYAHHPTEVRASLETARTMFPCGRIFCIFQPHQASRTARLLDEFAQSLENADMLAVAEIFRAREGAAALGEVTAADLAARVRGPRVLEQHRPEAIADWVVEELRPGDVLITMGAGDIGKFCHGIAQRIREHRAAG